MVCSGSGLHACRRPFAHRPADMSADLQPDKYFSLHIIDLQPAVCLQDIPLDVVYEDDHVMVVNKVTFAAKPVCK